MATGYGPAGYDSDRRDYSQVVDLLSTKQCRNLPSYPLRLTGATGRVQNGSPLICGGYGKASSESSNSYQSSCYMYDRTSQTWNWHSNMNTKRQHAASALMTGALWVTGGYNLNQGYIY